VVCSQELRLSVAVGGMGEEERNGSKDDAPPRGYVSSMTTGVRVCRVK